MANFIIGSAGQVVTGTDSADLIELISGFSASTVDGLAGADTLKISSTSFTDATVYLRDGADTITATNSADIKSSKIILGAGADTFTYNAESAGINNSTIRGNEGQDRLALTFTGISATASSIDIGTNQGNDTIIITSDETLASAAVGAGAGADAFTFVGDGIWQDSTLAGGFGEDTITANGDFKSSLIRLGQGSNVETDSADLLQYTGLIQNSSVKGGAGNDTIQGTLEANSTSTVIEGNAGNDTMTISATGVFSGFQARGGAGEDTINLRVSADLVVSSDIYGGAGNDVISGAATAMNIYGGAGADTMVYADSAATYHYTEGDSDLGALDLIDMSSNTDNAAAADVLEFTFASAVTAMSSTAFTAASFGDVASADITILTGAFVNFQGAAVGSADLTAAVGLLDSVLTTGEAVNFVMSAASTNVISAGDDHFVFVKGAGDDSLVKLGSAGVALSADSGHYQLAAGESAEDLKLTI